ncbi:hypothetical protein J2853_003493 [Streptosporangium lutulentum]|uniref:Uncharacterized protein n=1 Tax=Streptosporangium lutulentum TaxID=1461250 RepID=A0ABT9QC93_9ACTN|nr:hypothetical protein [Streptosporangium lutulentum]MDP9844282.1 hypothetical protein [Streptosporangium lutulentum]
MSTLHSLSWRAMVWACGTAALLVAMPPDYRAGIVMPLFAALIGLLAAAEPESPWVLSLEVATVVAWLLTTVVYGYAPSWIVALAIGALLYIHHAMAALAAHLPVPARIPLSPLIAWLGRLGGVLAASVALCLPVTALAGASLAIPSAVAVVLGAGGALGVAYVLTRPEKEGRGRAERPGTAATARPGARPRVPGRQSAAFGVMTRVRRARTKRSASEPESGARN